MFVKNQYDIYTDICNRYTKIIVGCTYVCIYISNSLILYSNIYTHTHTTDNRIHNRWPVMYINKTVNLGPREIHPINVHIVIHSIYIYVHPPIQQQFSSVGYQLLANIYARILYVVP